MRTIWILLDCSQWKNQYYIHHIHKRFTVLFFVSFNGNGNTKKKKLILHGIEIRTLPISALPRHSNIVKFTVENYVTLFLLRVYCLCLHRAEAIHWIEAMYGTKVNKQRARDTLHVKSTHALYWPYYMWRQIYFVSSLFFPPAVVVGGGGADAAAVHSEP